MTAILEVKNLVKKYKQVTAVDDVSLVINEGICFGLLGPNGAGKTTALEVIENIVPATSGQIFYKGAPRAASFREEIGIQFQHTTLLNFMTVKETLETFQRLYADAEAVDTLAGVCNLQEVMNHLNDKISGGQKQRLMLAMALINKPELLFLDEPSTGLDPQARRHLWEIIQGIKHQGKTIILTTHSMEEAEYLCDTIAIMDHGKIIAEGSPASLVKTHCSGGTIILPKENINQPLDKFPFAYKIIRGRVEIRADNIHAELEKLLHLQVDFTDMTVRSHNLEDVFLKLTGRQLRD